MNNGLNLEIVVYFLAFAHSVPEHPNRYSVKISADKNKDLITVSLLFTVLV